MWSANQRGPSIRDRGLTPEPGSRGRRTRVPRLERLENRTLLATLQFSSGLGEQSTLDSVAQAADFLSDVNSAGSQQFSKNDGTAYSTVTLTAGSSTTGSPGINLDILSNGSVAKNGPANTSVSAGLADASGNIGPTVSVPVTIVASDASQQVGDPADVHFGFAFNVKTFASNNATASFSYSASYTYDGVTTPIAGSVDQLGGSGITPIGSGPVDLETGTLDAHIGDRFTLTFSENLAGQTIAPFLGAGINNVGWLIDANLDASVVDAPIIPITPSFDTNGGVNYGYKIESANLSQPTTIELDWASGTSVDQVIGKPIVTSPTQTEQGSYDLAASAAQLGLPPTGAAYLLVVADPNNLVAPADPSKVASLALPNLAVQSINWHASTDDQWNAPDGDNPESGANAGGVDISYSISVAALPQAAPIALYWVDGSGTKLSGAISTGDDGSPLVSQTADNPNDEYYSIHVPASQLLVPPTGAAGLLVSLDPSDSPQYVGLVDVDNERDESSQPQPTRHPFFHRSSRRMAHQYRRST